MKNSTSQQRASSAQIMQMARDHLIQPWPTAGKMGTEALGHVSASDGHYVIDGEGRKLLDGPAGMWCMNLGHGNEVLVQAMAEQAMSLSYASPWYTTTDPAAELSSALARRTPGDLRHAFFTCGGTEAVESGLRFMQFYNNLRGKPEKKLIVSRGGAYHGSSYLTGSLNGKPRDRDWMDASPLVLRLSCPDPFRRPEGMKIAEFTNFLVEEFETLIRTHGAERIGIFVAEPIQASGGVIVPPPQYLQRMHELCRKNDILYLSDEVVTAFGRLGTVFASEDVFGIQPDMISFAKGVTAGYFPFGGVMISDRLLAEVRASGHEDAMFSNGYTYSSHPIGAAVALKTLELLEDGVLSHVRSIAPYFQAQLRTLETLPLVGEVRGMGLMACVECVADRVSNNPLALDIRVGSRIDAHCHELGLLVRPLINMCVMSPPLTITRGEIDRMVEILGAGIRSTQDDLVREGLWTG
jgi:adenosylmethionine-8-amino-7-oxononanoate aminotransferase